MRRKSLDEMTEAELRTYAHELEARLAQLERVDYVYFCHDAQSNTIKIGHSHNVRQRIAALSRQSGRTLMLLGVIVGDKYAKKRLQQQFAAYALADKEWFAADARLMDYIAAHAEQLED
jgi:hypothetical protein